MTFLNPFVLLGLAAAAIPVVVHLFNFRRPERLDFSTLRFLRAVEATALRRMRIRQWLLLALRTLALLALVLAFARPTRPADAAAALADDGARSLAVVLDNSRSAAFRDADGARLDRLRAASRAVLSATRTGDDVTVVPTAAPAGYRPVPYASAAPALDAVDALPDAPGAETLTQAIARAAAVLETATHPRREIAVVTDLQASTFTDSAAAALPDGVRLRLLPVGRGTPANTAVTDVRVTTRLIEPGRPVEVVATVRRWGGRAGPVGATLRLDGRVVAETAVDVAPGGEALARFTVTPRGRGWTGGEVRLEGDDAPWDDARFFAIRVPPPPRVRLVAGDGARADLVRLALDVAAERGAAVVTESAEGALGDLTQTDAVVLVGPADASAAGALASFVGTGGGLLVFPGEDTAALAALLGAVGGGTVGETLGAAGGPRIGGLTATDLDHPLFAGVFDSRQAPESPDVRRAIRYAPGGGDEATLMRLTTGTPLLQEIRHGEGRVLLAGVAADPAWSDLPLRGLFVPLVHRSAVYLASGSAAADADALVVGRAAPVRVDGAVPGLRLVAPDGTATEPPQRAVPGGVLLDVDGVDVPGLYRVVQGERTLRVLAANEPARESDPTPLAPREAARRLEQITGRPVTVVEDAAALGDADSGRVPLWTWLLALALVALVAESVVATAARRDASAA